MKITRSTARPEWIEIIEAQDMTERIARLIYLHHPLGMILAKSDLDVAYALGFEFEFANCPIDAENSFNYIHNRFMQADKAADVRAFQRVFGISGLSVIIDGQDTLQPLFDTYTQQAEEYAKKKGKEAVFLDQQMEWQVSINTLSSLNLAGTHRSSTSPKELNFLQPQIVANYHPSRLNLVYGQGMTNEYSQEGFGYVAFSIYRPCFEALKDYLIQSIARPSIIEKTFSLFIHDDNGADELTQVDEGMNWLKKRIIGNATNTSVDTVGKDAQITTIDWTHAVSAFESIRVDTLKEIALCTGRPFSMIANEALANGFGEGKEDKEKENQYLESLRRAQVPLYEWIDEKIMRIAWNKVYFDDLKASGSPYYLGSHEATFRHFKAGFKRKVCPQKTETRLDEIQIAKGKMEIIQQMQQLLGQDAEGMRFIVDATADTIKDVFEPNLTDYAIDFEQMMQQQEFEQQHEEVIDVDSEQ